MRVLGLITEYNPFHNGHLYHLQQAKEITGATHSVAVMSGNFLQRGEPALLHKWARAEMAVASGVDLVVELPTVYACSTAELFAYGSVRLLDSMGLVDCLCFGSEAGELDYLEQVARLLADDPQELKYLLREELGQGLTFPEARGRAIVAYLKSKGLSCRDEEYINAIIKSPNNILAIEYLKALYRLSSSIAPYTILRKKADYHSRELFSDIASATAIRQHLSLGKPVEALKSVMPPTAYCSLSKAIETNQAPVFSHHFQKELLALFRRESPSGLTRYFDVNEGLENKIFQCSQQAQNLQELYSCLKTKRYTLTRLQRIAMHILLNITREEIECFNSNEGPQYIRVLAFNSKGRQLLKHMKDTAALPIITKLPQFRPQTEAAKQMLAIDIRATNIYRLAIPNIEFSSQQLDYVMSPVYVKDSE